MNQNGTPMPAGTAIHNLTTLLADTGTKASTFTTGSLSYSVSCKMSNDNSLLFEKSDGTYWISLWDEVDRSHNVTVTLSSPASEVKVFDPLTGTNATKDVQGASSVTVKLTDHPLLVEVIPSNVTPTASCDRYHWFRAGFARASHGRGRLPRQCPIHCLAGPTAAWRHLHHDRIAVGRGNPRLCLQR